MEVVDPLGQGRAIDKLATKKFERNVRPVCVVRSKKEKTCWKKPVKTPVARSSPHGVHDVPFSA